MNDEKNVDSFNYILRAVAELKSMKPSEPKVESPINVGDESSTIIQRDNEINEKIIEIPTPEPILKEPIREELISEPDPIYIKSETREQAPIKDEEEITIQKVSEEIEKIKTTGVLQKDDVADIFKDIQNKNKTKGDFIEKSLPEPIILKSLKEQTVASQKSQKEFNRKERKRLKKLEKKERKNKS